MTTRKNKLTPSIKNVKKWVNTPAYDVALKVEKQKLNKEPITLTDKDIDKTIAGSMKRFFDGEISDPVIRQVLKTGGIDLENIRQSVVEQTLGNAIPDIVSKGEIERLIKISEAIEPKSIIPPNATITRERVIIEIDGDNVREIEQ